MWGKNLILIAAVFGMADAIGAQDCPNPTPNPPPPQFMLPKGMNGRICRNNQDCATGSSCVLAGNQPLALYPGAQGVDIIGPKLVNNYYHGGSRVEQYGAGCVLGVPDVPGFDNDLLRPQCQSNSSVGFQPGPGVLNYCVNGYQPQFSSSLNWVYRPMFDSAAMNVSPWTQPSASPTFQYRSALKVCLTDEYKNSFDSVRSCAGSGAMRDSNHFFLRAPAGQTVNYSVVKWISQGSDAGFFECQLQKNDVNRLKNGSAISGCACNASSEPVRVSKTAFDLKNPPISSTGVQCSGGACTDTNVQVPRYYADFKQMYDSESSPWTNTKANGDVSLYFDNPGQPFWSNARFDGAANCTLGDAGFGGIQMMGQGGVGAQGAPTAATVVTSCLLKCPSGSTRNSTDPYKCNCPAGQTYDDATNTCKSCPEGSVVVNGQCQCPQGYSIFGSGTNAKCRPNAPTFTGSNESAFFKDVNGYPICGEGRLPVGSSYSVLNISTSKVPNYSPLETVNGISYPYARKVTQAGVDFPQYLFSDQNHCACLGRVANDTEFGVAKTNVHPLNAGGTGGSTRFVSDRFADISSLDQDGMPDSPYGMVAISKDPMQDGRKGSLYQTGQSFCGCPNINERPVLTNPGDPQSGVTCASMVDVSDRLTSQNLVFAKFDPVADESQVMSTFSEPKGADGKFISKILLPTSVGGAQTTQYDRRIWKCRAPYVLENGKCIFDIKHHVCDEKSVLSPRGLGWNKTVNKRLACCMNEFGSRTDFTAKTGVRFDCVDNSNWDGSLTTGRPVSNAKFDVLWSSNNADGAVSPSVKLIDDPLPNALVLTGPTGRPLTGFYTLKGQRCNEFNEFMGDIESYRITKNGSEKTALGRRIPGPKEPKYFVDIGGRLPSTPQEMKRCPVLVRAALVTKCAENPVVANAPLKTLNEATLNNPPPANPTPEQLAAYYRSPEIINGQKRCSIASNIQIHVRTEQVYEIEGEPTMRTVDSVMDQKNASNISIDRLISNKYGNQCPPGTTRQGDACVY